MGRMSISAADSFIHFRAEPAPLSLKSMKGDWEGKKMMGCIAVFSSPSLSMTHPSQNLLNLSDIGQKKVLTSKAKNRKWFEKSLRLQHSFNSVVRMFSEAAVASVERTPLTMKQKKKKNWVRMKKEKGRDNSNTELSWHRWRPGAQHFHHLFLVIHYASGLCFTQMLCID